MDEFLLDPVCGKQRDDLSEIEAEHDEWGKGGQGHAGILKRAGKALARDRFLTEAQDLEILDLIDEPRRNVFIIDRRYYFFPPTNKWRSVGKRKAYYSRGLKDFYRRFFITAYRFRNPQEIPA